MISPNQFKNGMTIKWKGGIYRIVEFQHVKPGKGGAFIRTRLKNLTLISVIEKTFRPKEQVEKAFIESKEMEYLYREGDIYTFMDPQTFEQISFDREKIGQAANFLKENCVVTMNMCEGNLIEVILPAGVNLTVESTEPGIRGDTAKTSLKPARLETGLVLQVPLFINKGDVIRVDTRTGEYLGKG